IGPYDWYREGADWLVKNQRDDGSWYKRNSIFDEWPIISTSFSLLFLSKGRTPVLMSKIVHAPRDPLGQPTDSDWNNDRNDLKNLVDFCSKNVFKKTPHLAWQSFDMARALKGSGTDRAINEAAGELLPSPIAYFNGHKSPLLRFSEQ